MMAMKAPTFSARNVSEVSGVSQVSKPAFVRHGSGFLNNNEVSREMSDGAQLQNKLPIVQPKFMNGKQQ